MDVAQLQLPAHRLGPQPTTDLDGRRVGPGSVSHSLGGVHTTIWSNLHPLDMSGNHQKSLHRQGIKIISGSLGPSRIEIMRAQP